MKTLLLFSLIAVVFSTIIFFAGGFKWGTPDCGNLVGIPLGIAVIISGIVKGFDASR
jgi:hypothetical protein